jgi:aminopeptidase-like protein
MLLLVKLETADKVTWASFVIIEETNSVELLDTFTCASSISKDDTSIDETAVRLDWVYSLTKALTFRFVLDTSKA